MKARSRDMLQVRYVRNGARTAARLAVDVQASDMVD